MRHPVIGRHSAHASFLPRPLGNGIPHHHALLHLAKFTEVLLQALYKDSKVECGQIHPDIRRDVPHRPRLGDALPAAVERQWGRVDHVVFVSPQSSRDGIHGLSGHSAVQPIRPRRAQTKLHLATDCCFDTAAAGSHKKTTSRNHTCVRGCSDK